MRAEHSRSVACGSNACPVFAPDPFSVLARPQRVEVRMQELEVELEMPTRHRHEGVGDVSLIVRDAKPRRAVVRAAVPCMLYNNV